MYLFSSFIEEKIGEEGRKLVLNVLKCVSILAS